MAVHGDETNSERLFKVRCICLVKDAVSRRVISGKDACSGKKERHKINALFIISRSQEVIPRTIG